MAGDPDTGERRRKRDKLIGKIEWVWQNGLPLVAIIIAAIAVQGNTSDIQRQKEGRAVAVDVLCGFGNGVATAGRKALSGELAGQTGRGLPPEAVRDYTRTVTSTLLKEAGITGTDVLKANGEIDCTKLKIVARTAGQPAGK